MWNRLHRKHVIMAFPSFDTATNSWVPQADITWCIGPTRESAFVRFTTRVTTENEAVSCALHKGVSWIDQRLKHLRNRQPTIRERRGDVIEALPQSLKRSESKQLPVFQLTTPASQRKTLTFGQFKSVMARVGLRGSEQSLHKSYDALIKLRKTRHYSWAEIRNKVQRSQELPATARQPARGAKAAGLPLTTRDWRRIV
jgi:hypothetical protein